MPYPPHSGFVSWFGFYVQRLEQFANDPTLRDRVLKDKSQLEKLISDLNSHDAYITKFYNYVAKASISELNFDVRQYQRTIDDLPPSLHSDPEFNKPLVDWKRYLERMRDELKEAIVDKGGGVSPAHKRAAAIASDVQTYLEAVRLLEEQCEKDVMSHPTQEKEIRRRYRKSIDALSEGDI